MLVIQRSRKKLKTRPYMFCDTFHIFSEQLGATTSLRKAFSHGRFSEFFSDRSSPRYAFLRKAALEISSKFTG